MAYSPRLLGQPAKPSQIGEKLAKTWDILSPYVTGPVDAWKGLMEADLNTLLYDKGAGGRKAVEDAFNVAGTVAGGSSVVPKPSNALNMGIKAYHGSPHSFDKFDMSKIGTGEGAQAYGHGLYFADSENVAKSYRDNLLGRGTIMSGNADSLPDRWQMLVYEAMKKPAGEIRDSAIEALRAKVPPEYADQINALLDNKGFMYEVNIDADPNAFLDWDKPLSEQPEAVRNAFNPQFLSMTKKSYGNSGNSLYDAVADIHGREKASSVLREAGIPGIKYLDAGSRAPARLAPQLDGLKAQLADAESKLPTAGRHTAMVLKNQIDDLKRQIAMAEQPGTRNYVVFDDKLISIVRKYGIAGASAMLGYNVLEGMDKAQADTLNKADFDYRADEFYRQGGV